MRKLLVVGTFLLVIFIALFRERIFLRDPLGKVERNAAVQDGTRVYINYSNDVLLEDAATHQFVLVQNWNATPGVPKHLACFTGLACWTDADQATVLPVSGSSDRASMSAKEIAFKGADGMEVKVHLR